MLLEFLRSTSMVICADGGANAAARIGVRPDLIIGDLDSILPATLRKFKDVPSKRITSQNSTDLEKALSWAIRKRFGKIVVLGATGKRLDHSVGNLSALVKYSRKAVIRFVDGQSEISYVGRSLKCMLPPGTTVSLIPLTRCEGIVTKGLKWELRNDSLMLGQRESTSNVVKSSPVSIRVRKGHLLLYRLS
jgi:thiamine pyrophosphokinase